MQDYKQCCEHACEVRIALLKWKQTGPECHSCDFAGALDSLITVPDSRARKRMSSIGQLFVSTNLF